MSRRKAPKKYMLCNNYVTNQEGILKNGFMGPPATVTKKGGRSLRNLNPRKAIRVVITNSQNKENGQSSITCYSTRVTTGMEKDEEKELHLQVAMQTQKASLGGTLKNASAIPIPKVQNVDQTEYSRFRPVRPRIRNDEKWIKAVSSTDYCMNSETYEMDEEDSEWLERMRTDNSYRLSDDEFENLMTTIENNSRKKVISMAAMFVKQPSVSREIITLIYDYWLDKRLRLCKTSFPSASLIPVVPTEGDYEDKNPYVAFRKRETDIRRRSTRLAFNQTIMALQNDENQKNPETIAVEREEAMERLRHSVNQFSEMDGDYAFKRLRSSAYLEPSDSTAHDELMLLDHRTKLVPQKEVQKSLVIKQIEKSPKRPRLENGVEHMEHDGSEPSTSTSIYVGPRTLPLLKVLISTGFTSTSAATPEPVTEPTTSDDNVATISDNNVADEPCTSSSLKPLDNAGDNLPSG
ncbi:unnamed protein product [Bursaphelenchus okinawaensis]|uniref:Enhancer of polycomb-like protein n=1 Tax=Bursaphelenchus okinawaensis TaxID=465554 RepID=A0A811KAK3_9BILA|nr:unnamed protein product [Bursaphelenchus okinawaensis]CAG9095948.1 unnamed protein product [Bursaphelenchus okinawaensis]